MLCFFLLLFAAHFSPGLGPLCERYCTHRPSNSSGLQMFTPGECLHCGGSLRPRPSTIKSHSEGELTLSSCQLCSAPELSVHWCYPANRGRALPKTRLLSWWEKKLQKKSWPKTANQALVPNLDRSCHYSLFSHIGLFPASSQKRKLTHMEGSLVGWALRWHGRVWTQLRKTHQGAGEGHACSLQTPCTPQCPWPKKPAILPQNKPLDDVTDFTTTAVFISKHQFSSFHPSDSVPHPTRGDQANSLCGA